MKSNNAFFLLCFLFCSLDAFSQIDIVTDYDNRPELIARVKQVDEFIHRFNFNHQKIDIATLNVNSRAEMIPLLIDYKYAKQQPQKVNSFIQSSLQNELLSFYDDDWYAVVKCEGVYRNKNVRMDLVLQVETFKNHSSKWTLVGAYAPFLNVEADCTDTNKLISPSNNEVGFLGLNRVFADPKNIGAYTPENYQFDYLSILLHEVKLGNFKFTQTLYSKYYFTKIQDWVFVLEHFNREGFNSGWLISEVIAVKEKDKKQFLYDKIQLKK